MTSFENILVELKDDTLCITINRPKQLNALNKNTISELGQAIQEAYTNPQIKAVLLTGSGEKAFVAGADIKEFAHFNGEQGKVLSAHGHRIFKMFEDCPKPTVAVINGFALGGGLELAMACHVRVASDNARFSQPEVSLGVTPGYGGTQRLVQLIGKGKAMELLMSGEMIKADEALRLGLVNYVFAPADLLNEAKKLIAKFTKQSPVAIRGVIKAVNDYFVGNLNGFDSEIEEFGNCFDSEDFTEGTTAFLKRRKANFPGK